jgi:hypothetical protein
VTPSTSYTVSVWVFAPKAVTVQVGDDEFAASGGWVGDGAAPRASLGANEARQLSYQTTTTSGTSALTLSVVTSGSAQASGFYVDGWTLTPAGSSAPAATTTTAATTTATTTIAASSASRVYGADFETGNFSQISSLQQAGSGQISLVGSPTLGGADTARVVNDASDQGVAGSGGNYRTEMNVKRFSDVFGGGSLEGKSLWVGWDILLDKSFPIPASWAVVSQFHAGYGSPIFDLGIDSSGRLLAEARGGAVLGSGGAGNYHGAVLQSSVRRGAVIHVKVFIHWSTTTAGKIDVYLDGALAASLNGPDLVIGYESSPYMKLGVYRGDAPSPSIAYYDNIRWATAETGL